MEVYFITFDKGAISFSKHNLPMENLEVDNDWSAMREATKSRLCEIGLFPEEYCIIVPDLMLSDINYCDNPNLPSKDELRHFRGEYLFTEHLEKVFQAKEKNSKFTLSIMMAEGLQYLFRSVFVFSKAYTGKSFDYTPMTSSYSRSRKVRRSLIDKKTFHWDNHFHKKKFLKLRTKLRGKNFVSLNEYIEDAPKDSTPAFERKKPLLGVSQIDPNLNLISDELNTFYDSFSFDRKKCSCARYGDLIVSGISRNRIAGFTIIDECAVGRPLSPFLTRVGFIKKEYQAHVWRELQSKETMAQIEMWFPSRTTSEIVRTTNLFENLKIKKLPGVKVRSGKICNFTFLMAQMLSRREFDGKSLKELKDIVNKVLCRSKVKRSSIMRKIMLLLKKCCLSDQEAVTVCTNQTRDLIHKNLPAFKIPKLTDFEGFPKVGIHGSEIISIPRVDHKGWKNASHYKSINLDEEIDSKIFENLMNCCICIMPFSTLWEKERKVRQVLDIVGDDHLFVTNPLYDEKYFNQNLLRFGERINIHRVDGVSSSKDDIINICECINDKVYDRNLLSAQLLSDIASLENEDFITSKNKHHPPESELYLFKRLKTAILNKSYEFKSRSAPDGVQSILFYELRTLEGILCLNKGKQNNSWRDFQLKRGLKPTGNRLKEYIQGHLEIIDSWKKDLPWIYKLVKDKKWSASIAKPKEKRDRIGELLNILESKILSRSKIQKALGFSSKDHFRRRYLYPALDNGFIESTFPKNPKHPKQEYQLTEKGEEYLKSIKR